MRYVPGITGELCLGGGGGGSRALVEEVAVRLSRHGVRGLGHEPLENGT